MARGPIAALVVVLLWVGSLEGQTHDPAIEFGLEGPQNSFVLDEPIMVYQCIRNPHTDPIWVDLYPMGLILPIQVEHESGTRAEYIGANIEYVEPWWKLDAQALRSTWMKLQSVYAVDMPGVWRLRANYEGFEYSPTTGSLIPPRDFYNRHWVGMKTSAELTVVIHEPTAEDATGLGILRRGKSYRHGDIHSWDPADCLEVVKNAPTSTFAKYCKFWAASCRPHISSPEGPARLDEAIGELQDVVNRYPVFSFTDDAQLALAWAFREKGDTAEALRQARKVVDLYPHSSGFEQASKMIAVLEAYPHLDMREQVEKIRLQK